MRVRTSLLALPFFSLGALAFTAAACGSPDPAPPPLARSSSTPKSTNAVDKAVRHDVAWAAAAAARCAQPGASARCAAENDVVTTTSSRSLRPRDVVSDVLADLPIKAIICAIARKFLGSKPDGENATDGGVDAGASAHAEAGADFGASPALFDMHGAQVGSSEASADRNVVWDIERCQAAVFVNADADAGIGAIAKLPGGYRGPARGLAASVIAAGSGAFTLDVTTPAPAGVTARVRQNGSDFVADLSLAAEPPGGLPELDASELFNRRGAGYFPWDKGTRALAMLPTGRAPRLLGADGALYVQYEDDAASSTTCGAQLAVAKLAQSRDPGDFTSPAGDGALAAIASSAARSKGSSLEAWCGDASGGDGDTTSDDAEMLGDSCANHDPSEHYCGELSCAVNGNGLSCCRSEPTSTIICAGDDSTCPAGLVCSIKTKPLGPNEPPQVCVPREPCVKMR